MPDTSFTITERDGSTHTADALTGDWYDLARTTTTRLAFYFERSPPADTELHVESGETHTVAAGTTEQYQRVVTDGTVTVDGTLTVTETGFNALRDYLDFAGTTVIRTPVNHQPWYHEDLPGDARVPSQVLKIEPSTDLQNAGVVGVWAIVTGGADRRNSALTRRVLELEFRPVAEASEYADFAALEADLKE